jgi:nicotinate-nucleotide adenylyltransferase
MMRLGIFGGTFDPIHLAHLIVAQEALRLVELDRILFIPASVPPHKTYAGMAPAVMRYEMVQLAIEGNPGFVVSDIELRRDGPSYTLETLRELRRSLCREGDFFFLIGEDNVRELSTWHQPEEILRLCTMVVVSRPGVVEEKGRGREGKRGEWLAGVDPELINRMRFITTPLIDISSTEIRRRVAAGEPIRYFVPERVEKYILEHGLYRAHER